MPRRLIALAAFTLAAFTPAAFTPATTAQAATLTVEVKQVTTSDGQLRAQVVDQASFDGKSKPIAALMMKATAPTSTITFNDIPPGRYAVRVHHDTNENAKMDSNLVGMPTEPYAFSNDAAGSFGPPSFDAAAFDVSQQDLNITVSLIE